VPVVEAGAVVGRASPVQQLVADELAIAAYDRLALEWIDRGCGRDIDHRPRPAESIQWVREALERGAPPEPPEPPHAEPDGQQGAL
jgi:hypothetical protein